jgi:hypothetical protein
MRFALSLSPPRLVHAATVLTSRPKLGQAALLIVLRPRPLLNLLPLDLVPGLKVGDSRQEPLHRGE